MASSLLGDRNPEAVFRRSLPFLVLPFTILLLVLDGPAAAYAGVAFGIGVILVAAQLGVLTARRSDEHGG